MTELTATKILEIQNPYDLFLTVNLEQCRSTVKMLQRLWHPDRCKDPQATEVSARVNELMARAEKGDWGKVLIFTEAKKGQTFKFAYRKKIASDYGTVYMGHRLVLFQVDPDNGWLYEKAVKAIEGIRYPTKMLEENFKRFVPRNLTTMPETSVGKLFTIYKGPDQVRISDVLDSGYDLQPGHISWILTGLYNFALFMAKAQYSMFGGLGLDSIYVNPKFRSVHILDGWWAVTRLEQSIQALPSWIIDLLPKRLVLDKKAVSAIDQQAIKYIGLYLLGDKNLTGSSLLKKYTNPTHLALINFLRAPVKDSLIEEYAEWQKIEKDLSSLNLDVLFETLYT